MKCTRCLLDDSIPGVTLNELHICNFCRLHDELAEKHQYSDFRDVLDSPRKGDYDCILGISGGVDSTYMLHKCMTSWEKKPLVVHFDNGWNSEIATQNMENLKSLYSFDCVTYKRDLNEINRDFLRASVSEADIPNDIAMLTLFVETANKYNVKTIYNGHNFRTEGSVPLGWTYMDGKYVESVAMCVEGYPNLTLKKQMYWAFKGFKHVRPLYYLNYPKALMQKEIEIECGWVSYGGKHCENIYTEFVGCYLLPKKFGIDKRILYLSAEVRSGFKTKDEAYKELQVPIEYDESKLELIKDRLCISDAEFDEIMKEDRKTFKDYETYHKLFKRWAWVFKIMAKMGLFSETFVNKYTKDVEF